MARGDLIAIGEDAARFLKEREEDFAAIRERYVRALEDLSLSTQANRDAALEVIRSLQNLRALKHVASTKAATGQQAANRKEKPPTKQRKDPRWIEE